MMEDGRKRSLGWKRLHATSFTNAAFGTIRTPVTTKPSGNGVIDIRAGQRGWTTDGNNVPEKILILPYGTDAANETFDLRIWGWQECNDVTGLWVPVLLSQVTVTLGNLADADLGTGTYMGDTVAITYGAGVTTEHTDANDVPGFVELELMGFRMLEFEFDMTGAASGNLLLKPL